MATVIGVDPDSNKSGYAFYVDGKLTTLENWYLPELYNFLMFTDEEEKPIFSIENVLANNFIYQRNKQKNLALQGKMGINVGRCQQAQQEIMRALDYFEWPYVLHKPMKGNWAKNKDEFKRVTGWKGQSNEETRSAAFFGFLEVR